MDVIYGFTVVPVLFTPCLSLFQRQTTEYLLVPVKHSNPTVFFISGMKIIIVKIHRF